MRTIPAAPLRAQIVSITPAVKKRLRHDVLRWARVLRYSPEQAISGDPDSALNFLGACIERFPDEFTHQHGREIFAWHREVLEHSGFIPPGPEAA